MRRHLINRPLQGPPLSGGGAGRSVSPATESITSCIERTGMAALGASGRRLGIRPSLDRLLFTLRARARLRQLWFSKIRKYYFFRGLQAPFCLDLGTLVSQDGVSS